MPGIFGIVSPEGVNAHRQIIGRMLEPVTEGRSPLLRRDSAVSEHGAVATVYLEDTGSPLASVDGPGGEVYLALYGAVHLDDQPSGESMRSAAGRLLERYQAGGLPAVCGLNGNYVLAIFEKATGRLTLVKDRHGYSRLYYWHDGDRLMFGSEYKAITWHPAFSRALDPVGAADIFLYRTPLEGRTLFRDIHSMPPAGILTFERGKIELTTYWKPTFCDSGTPIQPDHVYADELAERMRRAIRRRALPGTCLLITGGLDSRIVAGIYQEVAAEAGLVASTLGLENGQDVQVGRALAESLGIPHHHVPVGPDYLAHFAKESTWMTEAKNGAYASWIIRQAGFQAEHGLRYTLTGLFGNFISGKHYPHALFSAKTIEDGVRAVEGNLHPYLEQLTGILRGGEPLAAAQESAATLGMIYRRAESDSLISRGDAFNFYFRVCRHGNTEDSLGDVSLALEPYLDLEVFDYAMRSIPPQVRARSVYNPLLVQRHLPRAAKVVMGNTGRSLAVDILIQRSPALGTLDNLRRKTLNRLAPGRFSHAAHACVQHAESIRRESRAFVEEIFRDETAYADMFDPRAVRAMLSDHLAGKGNYYMMIDALVTFVLWRRLFRAV